MVEGMDLSGISRYLTLVTDWEVAEHGGELRCRHTGLDLLCEIHVETLAGSHRLTLARIQGEDRRQERLWQWDTRQNVPDLRPEMGEKAAEATHSLLDEVCDVLKNLTERTET